LLCAPIIIFSIQLSDVTALKPVYFTKAGFSIAATAKQNGVRLIAIVMGSKNRKVRDAKAKELLRNGFAKVPPREEATLSVPKTVVQPDKSPAPATTEAVPAVVQPITQTEATADTGWNKFLWEWLLVSCSLHSLISFVSEKATTADEEINSYRAFPYWTNSQSYTIVSLNSMDSHSTKFFWSIFYDRNRLDSHHCRFFYPTHHGAWC